MNKTTYRRSIAIGRACLVSFLAVLVLKLTGVTVNLRLGAWSLCYDFGGLSWRWVIAPIAVPVGMVLATLLTIITLFYKSK
jgi:hypothetical protein